MVKNGCGMNGKESVFLCNKKKKQTYCVKQVVCIKLSCLGMTVDLHIGTILEHVSFVNILHLRKKNNVAVRIFEDSHFGILQKNLLITAAGRRCSDQQVSDLVPQKTFYKRVRNIWKTVPGDHIASL